MDSPRPWEQEITADHRPPLSNTTPMKPTDDVMLNYINRMEYSRSAKTKRRQDFHAWLFFLTTLVATISYTAGLNPPGGFWSADDKAKGYIPGTSVMRAMFPRRYQVFYYSNTIAFFSSLMIIGMLAVQARGINLMHHRKLKMKTLVGLCFVSVGASYISGTWESTAQGIYTIVLFVAVSLYFSLIFVVSAWTKAEETHDRRSVASAGMASGHEHIAESAE